MPQTEDLHYWIAETHQQHSLHTWGPLSTMEEQIQCGLNKARGAMNMMSKVWQSLSYSIHMKLYHSCVLPTLLNVAEYWRHTSKGLLTCNHQQPGPPREKAHRPSSSHPDVKALEVARPRALTRPTITKIAHRKGAQMSHDQVQDCGDGI